MGSALSWLWHTVFFNPFMNLLLLFYAVLGDNLGLAVIVMAIVIRILLIPSTKKQMVMTSKMAELKPKLDALQKKFKNNPEQLSKEQVKMYKEVGYNPIGCLGTMLPQIFILAAIFGVIRTITAGTFDGIYGPIRDFVFGDGEVVLTNLHFMFWDLTKSFNSYKDVSIVATERLPYLLLGLSVGLVQFVSSGFMQKFQGTAPAKKDKKKKGLAKDGDNKDEAMSPEDMQAQMGKSMIMILPVMTAYITLSQPAVLGVYWFAQSLMFIVQYFIIDKEKAIGITKEMFSFLDRSPSKGEGESKNNKQSKK